MSAPEISAEQSLASVNVSRLIGAIQPDSDSDQLVKAAIAVARLLQNRAAKLQTPAERRQQAELDRMIQHPSDKATLTQMTEQSFLSQSASTSKVYRDSSARSIALYSRAFNPLVITCQV